MSRSRRSAAPPPHHEPLEFFLDRSLGRGVAEQLIALGWGIHRIGEAFPDDAQDVADEVWISHGLERGWVPLCKDGRIRGRHRERDPLIVHRATLFYLDNQQVRIAEMVRRFDTNRDTIERLARQGGPAAYAVKATGVRRTWP